MSARREAQLCAAPRSGRLQRPTLQCAQPQHRPFGKSTGRARCMHSAQKTAKERSSQTDDAHMHRSCSAHAHASAGTPAEPQCTWSPQKRIWKAQHGSRLCCTTLCDSATQCSNFQAKVMLQPDPAEQCNTRVRNDSKETDCNKRPKHQSDCNKRPDNLACRRSSCNPPLFKTQQGRELSCMCSQQARAQATLPHTRPVYPFLPPHRFHHQLKNRRSDDCARRAAWHRMPG
jgi:hypothetical protein